MIWHLETINGVPFCQSNIDVKIPIGILQYYDCYPYCEDSNYEEILRIAIFLNQFASERVVIKMGYCNYREWTYDQYGE